jgi:hypothetical protein
VTVHRFTCRLAGIIVKGRPRKTSSCARPSSPSGAGVERFRDHHCPFFERLATVWPSTQRRTSLWRQPVPLTLLNDVPIVRSQARCAPPFGQHGRRRPCSQLRPEPTLLVDGRVYAVGAVLIARSISAQRRGGIAGLGTPGRHCRAAASRPRSALHADGEHGATAGTDRAVLCAPE